jgi:hypothetical protein
MATTYTWEITGLKRRTVGALSDAIVKVNWIRKGVDDSSNTAVFGGVCLFDEPSTEGFTAYASLAEADVLGWITDIVSDDEIAAIKTTIDRNIAELVNTPTEITSSFPWS